MTSFEKTVLMLWNKGLSITGIADELRRANSILTDNYYLEEVIENIVTAPGNYQPYTNPVGEAML